MKTFLKFNLNFPIYDLCQKTTLLFLILILCILLSGCETKNDFYTGKVNYEYDDQTFFHTTHLIVSTKDGYYFFARNNLMFFDKDTQKLIPVCSQANCEHNNNSCDSYFELLSSKRISYYDNKLLLTMYDVENYTHYLCGVSLDGSKRTRYCDLLKLEALEGSDLEDGYVINGDDIRELVVHRGYAYYHVTNNGENLSEIRKIKIKNNSKAEIIYTCENIYSDITRIKGFEDHIYFQSYTYTASDTEEPEVLVANLYDYNILNEELSVCIRNSLWDYIPMSDKMYYLNEQGLNCYEFDDARIETVLKFNAPYTISYDENYFYVDNWVDNESREISVFDKSFQLIDQIELDNIYVMCLFGDENYLFCINGSDEGDWMEALDKSQIGTGKYEWIKLQ